MQNLNTLILAIESSCDDTGCAILRGNKVLVNLVASQAIHERFGGVVPELASRDHQRNIVPVVDAALQQAGVNLSDLHGIAVTSGPGLSGSLLVGMSFAKSLSLALSKPLIAVNHMQAHILAHFIESPQMTPPEFPFICLTVSGGHTQIVQVNAPTEFSLLGETIDDAVGEAFDKAAKILGLPYPGGPMIDRLAEKGNREKFTFAATHVPGYDYSFSGIKTSFLYFIEAAVKKDPKFIETNLPDICASYQHHLINVLLKNVEKVLANTGIRTLAVAGGVSANRELRKRLQVLGQQKSIRIHIPEFQYCTDNAAMVGMAGQFLLSQNNVASLDLVPDTRWRL